MQLVLASTLLLLFQYTYATQPKILTPSVVEQIKTNIKKVVPGDVSIAPDMNGLLKAKTSAIRNKIISLDHTQENLVQLGELIKFVNSSLIKLSEKEKAYLVSTAFTPIKTQIMKTLTPASKKRAVSQVTDDLVPSSLPPKALSSGDRNSENDHSLSDDILPKGEDTRASQSPEEPRKARVIQPDGQNGQPDKQETATFSNEGVTKQEGEEGGSTLNDETKLSVEKTAITPVVTEADSIVGNKQEGEEGGPTLSGETKQVSVEKTAITPVVTEADSIVGNKQEGEEGGPTLNDETKLSVEKTAVIPAVVTEAYSTITAWVGPLRDLAINFKYVKLGEEKELQPIYLLTSKLKEMFSQSWLTLLALEPTSSDTYKKTAGTLHESFDTCPKDCFMEINFPDSRIEDLTSFINLCQIDTDSRAIDDLIFHLKELNSSFERIAAYSVITHKKKPNPSEIGDSKDNKVPLVPYLELPRITDTVCKNIVTVTKDLRLLLKNKSVDSKDPNSSTNCEESKAEGGTSFESDIMEQGKNICCLLSKPHPTDQEIKSDKENSLQNTLNKVDGPDVVFIGLQHLLKTSILDYLIELLENDSSDLDNWMEKVKLTAMVIKEVYGICDAKKKVLVLDDESLSETESAVNYSDHLKELYTFQYNKEDKEISNKTTDQKHREPDSKPVYHFIKWDSNARDLEDKKSLFFDEWTFIRSVVLTNKDINLQDSKD